MSMSTNAILGWGYCWLQEGLPVGVAIENMDVTDIWELEDLVSSSFENLEAGIHCCQDAPMLWIACFTFTAYRGCPIIGDELDVCAPDIEDQEYLAKALRDLGLEEPHEQNWFLCSEWF